MKGLRVIRSVCRILVFALLALLGALSGLSCAPAPVGGLDPSAEIAGASEGVGELVTSFEPAPETEWTESLDEPAEEENAGVMLARSPSAAGLVAPPSFDRAGVVALAQAAPPTVDHETPTRPPRG
jgi:hypothetical protein